jgi:hypothetical protein
VNSVRSHLIFFLLSYCYHSILSVPSYLATPPSFPSALPPIPCSTSIILLSLFHSTHCLTLPFSIVFHFLHCLTTASFIVLHCFVLPPCSIPSYTASVIVLHSTSISVHLLFSMVYKPRYLGLYPHSDLFVNPLPCSLSDLIALLAPSLRSPLPLSSASVICP